MKYLKTFESYSDDIIDILYGLSDSPKLITSASISGKLLLFDLDIINKDYDKDEMDIIKSRLNDLGWSVLNVSKDAKKVISYDNISFNSTIYCSIIENNFLNHLKSKGVRFWKDLEWEDWKLNKSLHSNCIQSVIYVDKNMISIIDGTGPGNNAIDWIEIFDGNDEFRFDNPTEAEIYLIKLQIDLLS